MFLSCECLTSFAQENNTVTSNDSVYHFNIKSASFVLPQARPAGHYYHAIALQNILPPRDWTLDIVQAPMFNYSGIYTLPKSFSLHGGLSTIFVSTRIELGPYWNYSINNYHFGVGYQLVYNYGFLTINGQYNSILYGWEQQPTLMAGYSFEKTAVTLRGDLYYTTSINTGEGGYIISSPADFLNGWGVTATFEQRIHNNRVMSLGAKISYLRYHVIAWPALPVSQYKYIVPEFQIGLNF